MHLTTMPSALLSQILRVQDLRQKRVVAGDRGRSQKIFSAAHISVGAGTKAHTIQTKPTEKNENTTIHIRRRDFFVHRESNIPYICGHERSNVDYTTTFPAIVLLNSCWKESKDHRFQVIC